LLEFAERNVPHQLRRGQPLKSRKSGYANCQSSFDKSNCCLSSLSFAS
jgi:hypothetical protein